MCQCVKVTLFLLVHHFSVIVRVSLLVEVQRITLMCCSYSVNGY
jgi:hypothetical protein